MLNSKKSIETMLKISTLFRLFAVVAAAMMCALGASAYEFSIPNVTALPGQEVTIPVSLQNDAEDVAAFQFLLTCPASRLSGPKRPTGSTRMRHLYPIKRPMRV